MGTLSRVAFCTGDGCFKFLKGVRLLQLRPFCNKATNTSNTTNNNNSSIDAAAVRNDDAYRQLEKLDFMTAAKLLFTTPPKKKQFGIDFHLVQLFFACMPSLAVYLVAQYARYEIRRMEAEVELKKKQAEEEKAKEMESSGMGEKEEVGSDPELFKVKVRLDALEEALKEIVVESKKLSGENLIEDQEVSRREQRATVDPNLQSKLEGSGTIADNDGRDGKEKVNALNQDQEKRAGKGENVGGSSELKK